MALKTSVALGDGVVIAASNVNDAGRTLDDGTVVPGDRYVTLTMRWYALTKDAALAGATALGIDGNDEYSTQVDLDNPVVRGYTFTYTRKWVP